MDACAHRILAKVEGEDVKESKRDCENTEEDVADGEVRNEDVPRRQHLLLNATEVQGELTRRNIVRSLLNKVWYL